MFLKSIFQAVPEAFWVFWIPAMQCKNGAKGINLCCKSWPKENLFTDFCPRPLMKICQKTINHTLRTQCQGKDIDFIFKKFSVVNYFWTLTILKSSHRDLSNEGPSFILSLLEVGHWATNKWSFYDNSQILTALLANFLTLWVWEVTGANQDDKYLKGQ